jgi:hypothetical protein
MNTVFPWGAACIAIAGVVANPLWQQLRAGAVILDLGPRYRSLWITLAAVSLVAAGVSRFGRRPASVWLSLCWLAFGIGSLIQVFERLQIRERGIFSNGRPIPWTKLKSYRWDVPTNTVFFECRSALLRTFGFRVADETVLPKLDAILQARLPTRR